MIAGTHSGVGKTTITMGIMAALSKNRSVQGFKVGPDYIDTAYHSHITGSKSRNLDNYLMDDDHVAQSFYHAMETADIGIIEGAMGLYDGSLADPQKGSSASISRVLGCPIILVVDGSGMALSIAALVKGYCDFDPLLNIAGIIINRVSSQSHYLILKQSIETHTKVTCFGYLPKTVPQLPSRHLGLVPSCEIKDLDKKVTELAEYIEKTIDFTAIINLSSINEQDIGLEDIGLQTRIKKNKNEAYNGIKIGVAYDEAFNFYYEDNLDFLREQGAEIVFFSPLHQSELPRDLNLLYFGGGYPEQFAKELEANKTMKNSILHALEYGMPYYGECGGFMYLNQALQDFDGQEYAMVGWFNGTTYMTEKLMGFGYKTLVLQKNCVLGSKGSTINCHEFHHSKVSDMKLEPIFALNKTRDLAVVQQNLCGYKKGNGVAGYPHLHFYGNETFGLNLLEAAKAYNTQRITL